jgi:catechol 2,3-dioxygenase-like lactoylglutathione lyase family enzyme
LDVRGITPILNVSSIEASAAWFEALGWHLTFSYPEGAEEAGFAGVRCGAAEVFLCRGAQGARGKPPRIPGDEETGGVWMTWWLETPAAVDGAHALACRLGLEVSGPPRDEPWDVREFQLRHPDGHTFRVSSGLPEHAHPE